MSQISPLLLRLVGSSVSAASKAGSIIKEVLNQGDLGIRDKGQNDFQTEADRSSQNSIIASLSSLYPKVTIIGEEEGPAPDLNKIPQEWIVNEPAQNVLEQRCPDDLLNISEEDITVWVDPMDGTLEFTQGSIENVTVLIGIAVGNKPVAGVIHQPYYKSNGTLGRTVWGIRGVGVGGLEPNPPPSDGFTVIVTKSHSNKLVESALEVIKPSKVRRAGGAGYKVLMLMEGQAHAYVHPTTGTKRWDICASEAILSAMGGKLTDINGNFYHYDKSTNHVNTEGILAACDDHYYKLCIDRLAKYKSGLQS